MKLLRSLLTVFLSLVVAWPVHAAPNPLGRFLVVGDSLTAGFQNFSLFTRSTIPGVPPGGQEYGYAQVVAKQAGTDLRNPKVLYPGIPPALIMDSANHIIHAPGLGFRLNPLVQTLNISVPSYTVANALKNTIVYSQVLSNPTYALALSVFGASLCGVQDFSLSSITVSSVDCAVELRPDTVLVSLGSNDVLQLLTLGITPTTKADFQTSYDRLINSLKQTHARIMVANVPDVTATPYLWTRDAVQKRCGSVPAIPDINYFVVNLVDPTKASGDICTNYIPVPNVAVGLAQHAVADYNDVIGKESGVTLLDIHALFNDVQAGVKIPGRTTPLTTAFLGGLFSLDGLHPTNTGYAIMANKTIETMNKVWGFSIPSVDVGQTANNDPLVFTK